MGRRAHDEVHGYGTVLHQLHRVLCGCFHCHWPLGPLILLMLKQWLLTTRSEREEGQGEERDRGMLQS